MILVRVASFFVPSLVSTFTSQPAPLVSLSPINSISGAANGSGF